MASERERIAALETHYEHVDKTLTAMGRSLDAVRTEVGELRTEVGEIRTEVQGVRTELGGKIDDIVLRMAEDRAAASETKLKVALKVIGWLVGIVTTVLGAVIGGLFVFARFLLPKLTTAMQDVGSAIT